ncbi:MAG: (4Fe-4S)-binding protein [Hyphomicrobium sp.]
MRSAACRRGWSRSRARSRCRPGRPDGTRFPRPRPVQQGEVPPQSGALDVAEGRDLTITFNGQRCIHARFCVLGAPGVFRANTPGQWISPDALRSPTWWRSRTNARPGRSITSAATAARPNRRRRSIRLGCARTGLTPSTRR